MRISPSSRLVLLSVVISAMLLAVAARDVPADPDGIASVSTPVPTATLTAEPSPTNAPVVAAAAPPEPSSAAPTPGRSPEPTPKPSSTTTVGPRALASLVVALPVADELRDGYDRDLFRFWTDADGNGCNTRQEVLIARAVTAPQIGPGCRLSGGRWVSPYDGVTVTDASMLDIDHLVPLAEAWDSGAWAWTSDQREAYANDLAVPWALIAATAGSNRSKGDRDPAEWMPPLASDTCTYVADWVAVKVRWRLTVDPAEQQALEDFATDCASTLVPSNPPNNNMP